jgi:hypothetical protein
MADDNDDGAPYEVRKVISAVEEPDGSYVILELEMKGQDAAFAFPLSQIAPLIALLSQAGGKAQVLAGDAGRQQALETVGTEVFGDEQYLDIHFRLADGLDLPMGMTLERAAALREQLAASLAGTTSLPAGTTRQ